jgi:hypothetical protein
MSQSNSVGLIDLQIMWNRLIAVVEEQAQTLMRTASARSCVSAVTSPLAFSTCRDGCSPRRSRAHPATSIRWPSR